jgi:hypothetical protein
MFTFWAILAVLRLAYAQHGATLGWPLAVATAERLLRYRSALYAAYGVVYAYLARYSSAGSHRLRWGHEVVAGRPTATQAMEPVPRALCWA